jgi:hypothetical protein
VHEESGWKIKRKEKSICTLVTFVLLSNFFSILMYYSNNQKEENFKFFSSFPFSSGKLHVVLIIFMHVNIYSLPTWPYHATYLLCTICEWKVKNTTSNSSIPISRDGCTCPWTSHSKGDTNRPTFFTGMYQNHWSLI